MSEERLALDSGLRACSEQMQSATTMSVQHPGPSPWIFCKLTPYAQSAETVEFVIQSSCDMQGVQSTSFICLFCHPPHVLGSTNLGCLTQRRVPGAQPRRCIQRIEGPPYLTRYEPSEMCMDDSFLSLVLSTLFDRTMALTWFQTTFRHQKSVVTRSSYPAQRRGRLE